MDKIYFKADLAESPFEFFNGDELCSFCYTNTSPMLEVDDAYTIISSMEQNSLKYVCIQCLENKKYSFEQESEGGFLTEKGIITISDKYTYEKKSHDYEEVTKPKEQELLSMQSNQIESLMHTPPFNTMQGAVWQQHCKDFMAFIGTWTHEDFNRNSQSGNALEYFMEICSNADEELYQNQFSPNKSEYAENVFYAFECQHCKVIRGYVD